ncbi:MAG: hypothetical protein IJZ53_03460 [Tyzzerella sp.]|nr:hypothetical protein [Tyzzerella sp.]
MIKLYISELTNTKRAILQMKAEVEDCYHELSRIANEINMKVRIRQDIDDTLEFAKKRLQWEKDYLQSLANTVEACLNGFVDAEKIDNLPATNLVDVSNISYNLFGVNAGK